MAKRSRYNMYVQKINYLPKHLQIANIKAFLEVTFPDCEWAFIIHDKDVVVDDNGVTNNVESHLHLAFASDNAVTASALSKKLGDLPNTIEMFDGRVAKQSMFSYLVHATPKARAEGKYQYSFSEVTANFDFEKYVSNVSLTNNAKKIELDDVLADIISGRRILKSFFDGDVEHGLFYAKNKHAIDKAIDVRYKMMMSSQEGNSLEIVYIEGASGSGKTTIAKEYAKRKYGDYCLSGSSNDTVQDYMGEPVMIFDDARPGDFTASDWLKLLDPYNNKSSVASRYYNKYLAVKCIILTTTTPFHEFFVYAKNKGGVDEPVDQFMRRFSSVLKVHSERDFAVADLYAVVEAEYYRKYVGSTNVEYRYDLEKVPGEIRVEISKVDSKKVVNDMLNFFT